MDITFPDLLGFLGVAMIVVAYGWQQARGIGRTDWRHPAVNGIGAALLLYSLAYRPNPASITIEFVWLVISAYGILRALKARTAKGPN